MRAEGKYYGSQGGNGAHFLLSAMDRAGRHFGVLLGVQLREISAAF